MDYLVHPSVSEEINNREADPLTGNIIGAAIHNTRSTTTILFKGLGDVKYH